MLRQEGINMYIVSFFAFEILQDRLLSVVSSMKLS